jgi:chromosome segregation ATPase
VETPDSFASSGQQQMSVKGNGTELVVRHNKQPVEDMRVGGILEEILVLIARLEFDRRRTETHLSRESDICKKLKERLEKMSLRRAIELPNRVQREHEACINDITELNWHISFNSKAERKLIHKIEMEEIQNANLHAELEQLRRNVPLLEEKIDKEGAILAEISGAQREVEDLLFKAKKKLAETKERYEASLAKANKEREAMKAELDEAKRLLKKAK